MTEPILTQIRFGQSFQGLRARYHHPWRGRTEERLWDVTGQRVRHSVREYVVDNLPVNIEAVIWWPVGHVVAAHFPNGGNEERLILVVLAAAPRFGCARGLPATIEQRIWFPIGQLVARAAHDRL